MKVRMLTKISGTRDGEEWPEVGGSVDLPEAEARALVAGGQASEDAVVLNDSDEILEPQQLHRPGSVAPEVRDEGEQRVVEGRTGFETERAADPPEGHPTVETAEVTPPEDASTRSARKPAAKPAAKPRD